MAREYRQQVDPDSGQGLIVVYDDGEAIEAYPDPGWYGAQARAFEHRMGNVGRRLSTLVPPQLGGMTDDEAAADWARWRPYMEALQGVYGNATAFGETVASMAQPTTLITGGSSAMGQVLANVGGALVDEYLNYDPNQSIGDYGGAGAAAFAGDMFFRSMGRLGLGIEDLMRSVHNRGFVQTFKNVVPRSVDDLNAAGLKVVNPAQLLPPDDPLRGVVEQSFKGSQSSALPSWTSRKNMIHNQRVLRSRLRKALGLDASPLDFTGADLLAAETKLNKVYGDLADDLPEDIVLPPDVARTLANSDVVRTLNAWNLPGLSKLRKWAMDMDAGVEGPVMPPSIKASELFDLRSDMTKAAKEANSTTVVQGMGQRINELDSAVARQAGSQDWLERFARAREQWETLFTAQRPGVIGKEGDLNPLMLARSMTSEGNFGRMALAGDPNEFTNQETATLANTVSALIDPATYGNSQTTDRASFLKFAASAATEPWYAAATMLNTALVEGQLRGAQRGITLGGLTDRLMPFGGPPPAGSSVLTDLLYSTGPDRRNIGATIGAGIFSRPDEYDPDGGVAPPGMAPMLPDATTRDNLLGPFIGRRDDRQ